MAKSKRQKAEIAKHATALTLIGRGSGLVRMTASGEAPDKCAEPEDLTSRTSADVLRAKADKDSRK